MPSASAPLLEEVRTRQRAEGSLRFDEFMELVLYHPRHGYFSRSAARAGRAGDFLTSPELTPLFGATLMGWAEGLWRSCGADEFTLVEVGAGRGTLAEAMIAAATPALRPRMRFHLVERAEAPRAALEDAVRSLARDRAVDVHASVDELPSMIGDGVIIANELFDNLPVRRAMMADDLREIRVRHERGRFLEVLEPAPPELAAQLERQGVRLAPGQSAEVCESAEPLLRSLLGRLRSGGFAFFDYGGEANEVSGDAAPQGTLVAHRGHAAGRDYYAHLGEQDLSTHVNFTPLRVAALQLGFDARLESQARFLVQNGLAERLVVALQTERDELQKLRLSQQAKHLYHPEGMGEAFRVLHGGRGTTQQHNA